MPELQINLSKYVATDDESQLLQNNVSFAREVYAGIDYDLNAHEYLGVIESLEHVLLELEGKIHEQRRLYPDVECCLEFHKSCKLPKAASYMVYTFTLQSRRVIENQQRRLNTIVTWKFPPKPDYDEDNRLIDLFITEQNIQRRVDDSGLPCAIRTAEQDMMY